MKSIFSLDPIIDNKSKIMILGSMPSVQSLEMSQYYANPRNQFWKLIYLIFNIQVEEDYEKRLLKREGDCPVGCYKRMQESGKS